MISIILPQTPLLNTLFCICLYSYTLIWFRVISHWICVLVSVFVCASLPLLSKCVWVAKLLFRDYCFPSQRCKFAFISLIFDYYLGPQIYLPVSLCFILVSSGAHSTTQIGLGQKYPEYLEWQTIIAVKIARLWLWDISVLFTPAPHWATLSHSSFWCHSRGQGRLDVAAAPSSCSPMKAEGAALMSANLLLLLSNFLQKTKN